MMEEWQKRVHVEKDQLRVRLDKLSEFLTTPAFNKLPNREKYRLSEQHEFMWNYYRILMARIDSNFE
jgi:hypothetical protein